MSKFNLTYRTFGPVIGEYYIKIGLTLRLKTEYRKLPFHFLRMVKSGLRMNLGKQG